MSQLLMSDSLWPHQAPLFMGFPRQDYWNGLLFLLLGNLSDLGIKPTLLVPPALAGRLFTTEPPGKPFAYWVVKMYQLRDLCDHLTMPNTHVTVSTLAPTLVIFLGNFFVHISKYTLGIFPIHDTTLAKRRNVSKGFSRENSKRGGSTELLNVLLWKSGTLPPAQGVLSVPASCPKCHSHAFRTEEVSLFYTLFYFIFGCAGSPSLWAFFSCDEQGLLSRCSCLAFVVVAFLIAEHSL